MSQWMKYHTDGFVEKRRNSTADAVELRLFCINPLIYGVLCKKQVQEHG